MQALCSRGKCVSGGTGLSCERRAEPEGEARISHVNVRFSPQQ